MTVDTVSLKVVLAETPTHHLETYWLLLVRSRTKERRYDDQIGVHARSRLTSEPTGAGGQ